MPQHLRLDTIQHNTPIILPGSGISQIRFPPGIPFLQSGKIDCLSATTATRNTIQGKRSLPATPLGVMQFRLKNTNTGADFCSGSNPLGTKIVKPAVPITSTCEYQADLANPNNVADRFCERNPATGDDVKP